MRNPIATESESQRHTHLRGSSPLQSLCSSSLSCPRAVAPSSSTRRPHHHHQQRKAPSSLPLLPPRAELISFTVKSCREGQKWACSLVYWSPLPDCWLFQDCAIGLLFALLPVLGGNSQLFQGIISMARLLLVLSLFLTVASILSWSLVPSFLKLMIQLSSQTNELYQLASVAFCLFLAWTIHKHKRETRFIEPEAENASGGKWERGLEMVEILRRRIIFWRKVEILRL
ncbi:hypothetical protein MRB53_023604 [Persea americana]|uniref:Uncharacterized protein n=1 Tax=Persea americana TaxID=3435 RepID=A0ACC2L9X2_PERAE|nr:hypothetical protein MRB53_023604 [Persea americana]